MKDKRVDVALLKNEINPNDCEIFYSPIGIWIIFFFAWLAVSLPFSLYILSSIVYLIPYITVSYFIAAYLNNTVVVYKNEIIVINRNFPFFINKRYNCQGISKIKLGSSAITSFSWIFGIFSGNYIDIYQGNKRDRIYSIGLDWDSYDENFTKKTFDDFVGLLKKQNVNIESKMLATRTCHKFNEV